MGDGFAMGVSHCKTGTFPRIRSAGAGHIPAPAPLPFAEGLFLSGIVVGQVGRGGLVGRVGLVGLVGFVRFVRQSSYSPLLSLFCNKTQILTSLYN
jgi:hypothetical protein